MKSCSQRQLMDPQQQQQSASSSTSNSSSLALNSSQAMLSFEQVQRLLAVVDETFEVNGRGNFPTLKICLRQLIKSVTKRLNEEMKLNVKQVKLNGGAASHILASCELPYSDIDLIFDVDVSSTAASSSAASARLDVVKDAMLNALIELMPDDVNKKKITPASMKDAYVRKMVKVSEGGDLWSLITLNNHRGRHVELKFVDRIRRQFEFSVDSFQIHLDSLVSLDDKLEVTPKLYPTVVAESVFGDYAVALRHLNERLIDTVQPELIRGGGLLKYVQLLTRGYRPARSPKEFRRMERYMCSRFFIDFSSIDQQERKLRVHLDNHLQSDTLQTKYDFLLLLHQIVDESTVCLMNHERRLSLGLIERLAHEIEMELCYQDQIQHQQFQQQQHQGIDSDQNSSSAEYSPMSPPPFPVYHPKQTILFVSHNASYWIPVV